MIMGHPGRKKTPWWLCGAAVGLSLIIPAWLLWHPSGGILSFNSPIPQAGRVLLVTAHPDDETIFFSPTISALRHAGNEVFLLCFTNGNFHGLGQLRQQELLTAAAALQVDAAHVKVIDHENIQDGHHTDWDESALLRILTAETQANSIDTIVTFDEGGVYGHKNHKACFDAVRDFLFTCQNTAASASQPLAALPAAGTAVQTQTQLFGGAQLAGLAEPLPLAGSAQHVSSKAQQQASMPAAAKANDTASSNSTKAQGTAGVWNPSGDSAASQAAGKAGQPVVTALRDAQAASTAAAGTAGAGSSKGLGRQLMNLHSSGVAHRGTGGRKLRAGRTVAGAQVAAWHRIAAGNEPELRRGLAATGRLQAATSNSHAGVKLEAGRGCPKAYQLLTVGKLRKYASMLDVLPSALEGKLHLVTYVNRSIFATFAAMSAHNTQWRWWIHVITTRYTFVNTLQLLGPDPRLDNQTAITLAEHESKRGGYATATLQDTAELDRQTMNSLTGGN